MRKPYRPIVAIVLLLLGVALTLAMYHSYNVDVDKRRFQKVEYDMQATQLADSKITWAFTANCSRGHGVFWEGPPYCQLTMRTEVKTATAGDARAAIRKLEALFDGPNLFSKNPGAPATLDFIDTLQPGSGGNTYTHSPTGMKCGSLIELIPGGHLTFAFTCGDNAQNVYFSRSDT